MTIPGQLANSMPWQPSPNNGCRIPIRCRGTGSYIFEVNYPVQEAKLVWHCQGRSGVGTQFQGSGRPQSNIMVWHLDKGRLADSFTLEFRVATSQRVPQIQCNLYTAPFGTRMPPGRGWQPEDIGRHIH